MGAGTLQIVLKGKNDHYLTGNPQLSFFRKSYRRHFKFGIEYNEHEVNGSVGFGKKFICEPKRMGDLFKRHYLRIQLPTITFVQNGKTNDEIRNAMTTHFGHAMIDHIKLFIGNQEIDELTGEQLYLNWVLNKNRRLDTESNNIFSNMVEIQTNNPSQYEFYIPLDFWFKEDGLELPIISMAFDTLYFEIQLKPFGELINTNGISESNYIIGDDMNVSMFIESIYLDLEERKRFSTQQQLYLIPQHYAIDPITLSPRTGKYEMILNHPVKEILWRFTTSQTKNSGNGFNLFSYYDNSPSATTIASKNLMKTAQIYIDGIELVKPFPWQFFNYIMPYDRHSGSTIQGVHIYSFALNPESIYPSGTLNFSLVKQTLMNFEFYDEGASSNLEKEFRIFSINYNVILIEDGKFHLKFV